MIENHKTEALLARNKVQNSGDDNVATHLPGIWMSHIFLVENIQSGVSYVFINKTRTPKGHKTW